MCPHVFAKIPDVNFFLGGGGGMKTPEFSSQYIRFLLIGLTQVPLSHSSFQKVRFSKALSCVRLLSSDMRRHVAYVYSVTSQTTVTFKDTAIEPQTSLFFSLFLNKLNSARTRYLP
jgi:hypothetical protein